MEVEFDTNPLYSYITKCVFKIYLYRLHPLTSLKYFSNKNIWASIYISLPCFGQGIRDKFLKPFCMGKMACVRS